MNAAVIDSRHDLVELYIISHQSGQGGGLGISTDASYLSHGGVGGTASETDQSWSEVT